MTDLAVLVAPLVACLFVVVGWWLIRDDDAIRGEVDEAKRFLTGKWYE